MVFPPLELAYGESRLEINSARNIRGKPLAVLRLYSNLHSYVADEKELRAIRDWIDSYLQDNEQEEK